LFGLCKLRDETMGEMKGKKMVVEGEGCEVPLFFALIPIYVVIDVVMVTMSQIAVNSPPARR
jgi:hypothetical protein